MLEYSFYGGCVHVFLDIGTGSGLCKKGEILLVSRYLLSPRQFYNVQCCGF